MNDKQTEKELTVKKEKKMHGRDLAVKYDVSRIVVAPLTLRAKEEREREDKPNNEEGNTKTKSERVMILNKKKKKQCKKKMELQSPVKIGGIVDRRSAARAIDGERTRETRDTVLVGINSTLNSGANAKSLLYTLTGQVF